jgi:hypothetical protein
MVPLKPLLPLPSSLLQSACYYETLNWLQHLRRIMMPDSKIPGVKIAHPGLPWWEKQESDEGYAEWAGRMEREHPELTQELREAEANDQDAHGGYE